MTTIGQDLNHLWGLGAIRAFISHTSEFKERAKDMQTSLTRFSIASFVAHEDIEPMKEWETEIERALFSMDLLVALLTPGFSESKWTDQEVGVAVGLRVPVVAIRMGKDPYGFIGRFQGLRGSLSSNEIAEEIFEFTLKHHALHAQSINAFIMALDQAPSFTRANALAGFLEAIDNLTEDQEAALVEAFNSNPQVNHAYDILPVIVEHLKRMTGNSYSLDSHQLSKSNTLSNGDLVF